MVIHPLSVYMNHNIPRDICRSAHARKLDVMATGGGFDYIFVSAGKNPDGSDRQVILIASDDAGSPRSLRAKASLQVMLNVDWNEWVTFPYRNAEEALRAMAEIQENGLFE